MSTLSISYVPPKGDNSIPQIIPHPPTDESQALFAEMQIPDQYRGRLAFQIIDLDPVIHTDPRLRDYRVYLLLSDLTPDDPTDWSRVILEWLSPPQAWRLWRVWVFYRQAPLVGELRHESGYDGWLEGIYHRPWMAGQALPEDYFKVAQGFAYAEQTIRRPGHPPGAGRSFESREVFEQELRKAKAIVRRQRGGLGRRHVARQMGMSRSAFYAYLKRYPGAWEGT
jgi:hypothetical protein